MGADVITKEIEKNFDKLGLIGPRNKRKRIELEINPNILHKECIYPQYKKTSIGVYVNKIKSHKKYIEVSSIEEVALKKPNRDFYTNAKKLEKEYLNKEFEYTSRDIIGVDSPKFRSVGRPRKGRRMRRKPLRKYKTYEQELKAHLKLMKWSYFGTLTFDRNGIISPKTPIHAHDNMYLRNYKDYLPPEWISRDKKGNEKVVNPNSWEPKINTCHILMNSLTRILRQHSWKDFKFFYVIEDHADGVPHIHFLLNTNRTQQGDIEKVKRIWLYLRGGFGYISEIKKNVGAVNYCVKYITKTSDKTRWDFITSKTITSNTYKAKNQIDLENVLKNRADMKTRLEVEVQETIDKIEESQKQFQLTENEQLKIQQLN